ncbi:MAG: MlaD family protein [Limnothrix sp.]
MRSRTIKEGSLGLFIFAGLSLLSVVLLWLTGSTFGKKTYAIHVLFENGNGMREGAVVSYRGIEVGRIVGVQPSSNGVDAEIQIQSVDLVIPKDVVIEANQGGLVGETTLDIIPNAELNQAAIAQSPIASDCQELGTIICDEDRIRGKIGVSFEDTLRSTQQFSELYGDPAFVEKITALTVNSSTAAEELAELTKELTLLSQEVRGEVGNFSENAQSITNSAKTITGAAVSSSAQLNESMGRVNELTGNLNALVVENRQGLVGTLNSITMTSDQMQRTISSLDTTINEVNRGIAATDTQALMANLTALTTNASIASENLRDISITLNDPVNLVVLQKTLDSARVTFENTQKITSDLDELTGDPEFRRNLIDLVNGLSQLVSSTEQLQEQVQVAGKIEPIQSEWSRLDLSARPSQKQAKPRSFE